MHHAFTFSRPEVYSTETNSSASLGIRLLVPRSMDNNDVVPFQGHRQAQKKVFHLDSSLSQESTFLRKKDKVPFFRSKKTSLKVTNGVTRLTRFSKSN